MVAWLSNMKAQIAHKYQGVASPKVINAVQKASTRTGVDFAFLMEKASAESNFNPTAKSKSSSATGLFQFIENTWLSMVKRHGDEFGLGDYADQIEMKNGRCCVEDDEMKKKILSLRNDPEISALMAGVFTAENKAYLEKNTQCDVGSTEMYLAHFMGAGGATKFLNCRDYDGDAVAAKLFPKQAHANKNIFYDRKTGHARTLDQIYDIFDKKFTDGPSTAKSSAAPVEKTAAAHTPVAHTPSTGSIKAPAAAAASRIPASTAAQVLPIFDDANDKDDIIWSDDPRFRHNHAPTTGFSRRGGIRAMANGTADTTVNAGAIGRLSADNILVMQQEQAGQLWRSHEDKNTWRGHKDKYGYNS